MNQKLTHKNSNYFIKVLNTLKDQGCVSQTELYLYKKTGTIDANVAQRILIARELEESARVGC